MSSLLDALRSKWTIAGLCALVGAVALYFTFFGASDEDKINKVLSDFASIVSVKPGENILGRTAKMRSRMKDVVRDDVAVRVEELHIDVRTREKLEDEAAKAGLVYNDAECTFVNTKIEIDPAKTFAKVDTTALVTAKVGGERKIDKRPVHVLLRKDGRWLVDTMDVSQPTGE